MPTCCVPSCRSGYASNPNPGHITYHKFPKDKDRREQWIRRIHRDFTPNEGHRVCSLHFRESDFKTSSEDQNTRRKRSSEALQRRYLKINALPSLFENLPCYLSVEPAHERGTRATSTARLDAENTRLSEQIIEVLRSSCYKAFTLVTECGFNIVSVCADNHAVNRSFFSFLGSGSLQSRVEYPLESGNFIYVIIDPTHTLKNIYNNFQRTGEFHFPHEEDFITAKFSHIKELFHMEVGAPLKLAHKLTNDCLCPTNIQRSSFKIFAAVFHESTVNALKYYVANGHSEWRGTQIFVDLIHKLACIVNVKTPCVGFQKRDDYREPIRSTNDVNIQRLDEYLNFFTTWEISKKTGLTKPTFSACKLMCRALKDISCHLITECDYAYVLLGNVQSDVLEKRFGRYRQMSGSNYFISVRQLLESEKKLKIYNCLVHCNMNVSDLAIFRQVEDFASVSDPLLNYSIPELSEFSSDVDISLESNDLNVILYVAGYIVHCLSKRKLPHCCFDILCCADDLPEIEFGYDSEFLSICNRGGLKYPSAYFFNFCCRLYKIYCTLRSNDSVFKQLVTHPSPAFAFCQAFCCEEVHCQNGHDIQRFLFSAGRSMFNMFAKNFLAEFSRPKTALPQKIAKLRSSKL